MCAVHVFDFFQDFACKLIRFNRQEDKLATTAAPRGKAVTATTKDANPAATPAIQEKGVTRREFLYYIWGASLALFLAEAGGAIVWYALPRFRAGEFGGLFALSADALPKASATTAPVLNAAGKFWVSNTDEGLRALSQVCTHLGCLFKWTATDNLFECPCHGSQFTNKGVYHAGPAPRSLDRFAVTVVYNDGTTKTTDAEGVPVPSANAKTINVDTGKKILGKTHA